MHKALIVLEPFDVLGFRGLSQSSNQADTQAKQTNHHAIQLEQIARAVQKGKGKKEQKPNCLFLRAVVKP